MTTTSNPSLSCRRSGFKLALAAVAFAAVTMLSACGGGSGDPFVQPTRIQEATVTASNNPLVAEYSVSVSGPATVSVEFGPTTAYGQQTSSQTVPSGGGTVKIMVAGMKQNTQYHMRAVVTPDSGGTLNDTDRTFQTGAIPSDQAPLYTATVGSGQQPSPGVRLVSALGETFALNDTGDVLWYYKVADNNNNVFYLTKVMPNGDMIILLNYFGQNSDSSLREVDLAGNTVRELTKTQLAQKLTAAGYNINLVSIDHDVLILPNGDWIFIITDSKTFTDLPGYPGDTQVTGNGVVEVDQNSNIVWVWDAFDHLDVNRHPMQFPDWTHANSLFYNSADGSLLLSLRHQYWVLKLDYKNATGSGDVLWKLGYQGDFTLQNSTSPADWFYAQHDVNIISPNLTGNIQISLWDNGNNRVLDDGGDICGTDGQPACYSTAAFFNVNETDMTASRGWTYQTPFSFWGGSNEPLANGNVLFDETAPDDGNQSRAIETTQGTNPPVIWTLTTPPANPMYRVKLIPSLYPE